MLDVVKYLYTREASTSYLITSKVEHGKGDEHGENREKPRKTRKEQSDNRETRETRETRENREKPRRTRILDCVEVLVVEAYTSYHPCGGGRAT